ncbi:NADH:ubiquinone oxidoreductase subunit K [Enhygromyxa salina]|uniref:NADH-quinone oxidoreductase subunit K n=1 Tax=Enhygromyxa salina TaxID=215803 RepID=A0A2S9YAI1_9BACT|nr:NADH-quinone oxidoreductase subunit K [Enhygromyxa salina]PRQ02072.1 NADH:ubiquinone oxidoreductase subunit K [Enhygromyxa salina]
MLPITHYLYLALGLFGVGFGGALLRRSLIAALLGVALMLVAVALCFCAYARLFVDPGGQIAALWVILVGLCELGVVVAVVLRALRVPEDPALAPEAEPLSLLDDWAGGAGG